METGSSVLTDGRSQRRTWRLVMSLVLAVAASMALPAAACACGAFYADDTVDVPQERAVIVLADGLETITMELSVLSDGTEAGLIVPTPTPATVTRGNRELFDQVAKETAPRIRTIRRWLPDFGPPEAGASAVADGSAGGVQVLDQVQLGPIEATTLEATDVGDLRTWLAANDYPDKPVTGPVLADYIERGWSFVAMRVTTQGALAGELDPIQLQFAVDQPVYPLALSALATQPQKLELHVIADQPLTTAWHTAPDEQAGRIPYRAKVRTEQVAPLGTWITQVTHYTSQPSRKIRGDILLQATDDWTEVYSEIEREELVTVMGIPAWILGVGLVIVLVIVLVLWAGARVMRRREPAAPRVT